MTVTTTYPGVYIEEDADPSLSIASNSTSVPAILTFEIPGGPVIRFNSYLDVLRHLGENNDKFRAYFDLGGSYCYSVDLNHISEIQKYPDINLLVSAGYTPADAQISEFYDLCGSGSGRFGIIDLPNSEVTDANALDSFTVSSGIAVYYPYLKSSWGANIAPSIVMAALYCQNDRTRGVWKAPANIALPAGYQPVFKVSDSLQGQYTSGKALNMIRNFDDSGPVVWGARTLDDSDNWRYISVRRLFNSVERDLKSAMGTMVFEPNNAPTWAKVRTAITNYLHDLWRQGALMGSSEKEAYFVQIGQGVTMTDDDIAQGRMIAKVGLAAVRPAEFIILQFTQNVEQQ